MRREVKKQVPVWEKFMLTIKEAADYFHIGEKKLRWMIENHQIDEACINYGNRIMIKRKCMEEFLEKTSSI